MSLPPAAAAGRRRSSKRKPSGDTIEVKQKFASITISDSDDEDIEVQDEASRQLVNEASAARGQGKTPVIEDFDEDDIVEEYEFSSEEDITEDEDDFDDAKSVITLSSECSAHSEDGLPERPWKTFDITARRNWETMYLNITESPIGGNNDNWAITEDYQEKKDVEMLHYLEDYPLQEWVIPKEEADRAYRSLLERMRWRNMGIRIYGHDRGKSWGPGAPRAQQALNIPRDQYVREPPREQQRPPPPGQQGPSQGPPPPPHHHHHQHQPPQQLRPNPTLPHYGGPNQGPNGHAMYGHGPPNNMQPMGRGHPLPPPPHALPSQPYAHPVHMHHQHHGIGRPVGPIQNMHYGMPPYPPQMMHQQGGFRPEASKARRGGRDKKETPIPTTPPPPPPTPPYELREKPSDKKGNKTGRRNARRQAEADEFPWTRKLNFPEEKAKVSWDDGIYDPKTLEEMNAIRARNVPIIDDLDAKVQEQQRMWRLARQQKKNKEAEKEAGTGETSDAEPGSKDKKKMQRGQRKGESGGDPYHSGSFAFVGEEDEQKSIKLGFKTPDDALEAGEAGKVEEDRLADIKICWNPGKKGTTENLEQVKFSLKDTLVTRKQLKKTNVLNHRAAECIIDFCPDMLWRGMLLRICSEAGMGNKDVRDRFCYNGCYCDKATITKRISAALGQKQVQPKSKGYGPGEYEWYDENVKDFAKYIDYFGKRSSHRNMLKIQMQGEKRKMKQRELAEKSGDDDKGNEDGPNKRPKIDADGKDTSDAAQESDGDGEGGDGNESDGSDDSNAVSLQDSDILDKMEDD